MEHTEDLFHVETLQDWSLAAAGQIAPQEPTIGGGASNSNSCCNNSADEP